LFTRNITPASYIYISTEAAHTPRRRWELWCGMGCTGGFKAVNLV